MTSRPTLAIAIASIVLAACGGGDSDGADTTLPEVTLLTTTTEAPDFEESDGETAPDTTVADASTTVAESTTTVAATTAPSTSEPPPPATEPPATTPPPVGGEFVLGTDGLGAVRFGADPEQTIMFITSVIGAPTADTGWVPPIDIGPCGGSRIRQVSWNQLQLEFGDVSDITEGRDHFYAYFYGVEGSSTPQPPGLKTGEQIGAGSSVTELLAAYPDATLFEGDEFVGPSFIVNDNLAGRISGVSDDDVVQAVIGGLPCDG